MIIIKQKSGKFAKNPCNYCGDGVLADSETCGEGNDSNYYGANPTSTSGTAKSRCAAAFSVLNGYKYYINIPGVYCFTVKGGDGNYGNNSGNACSGATVKGCYKLKKDDVVTFKIGSKGSDRSTISSPCNSYYGGGGGGGASWVYLTRNSANTLLLVAGGGGGGGWNTGSCSGGSGSTSANTATYTGNGSECTDSYAADGTAVTTSNFTTSTGAGGVGGFWYDTKCSGNECDSKYACGGGGGGYAAGTKGSRDGGGGGGGSYVNTNTTYYSTGSSLTAGSTDISSSPSGGSITVAKPTSNATCSTTNCQWSSSYSACN